MSILGVVHILFRTRIRSHVLPVEPSQLLKSGRDPQLQYRSSAARAAMDGCIPPPGLVGLIGLPVAAGRTQLHPSTTLTIRSSREARNFRGASDRSCWRFPPDCWGSFRRRPVWLIQIVVGCRRSGSGSEGERGQATDAAKCDLTYKRHVDSSGLMEPMQIRFRSRPAFLTNFKMSVGQMADLRAFQDPGMVQQTQGQRFSSSTTVLFTPASQRAEYRLHSGWMLKTTA